MSYWSFQNTSTVGEGVVVGESESLVLHAGMLRLGKEWTHLRGVVGVYLLFVLCAACLISLRASQAMP
jgi:hypothetical protein